MACWNARGGRPGEVEDYIGHRASRKSRLVLKRVCACQIVLVENNCQDPVLEGGAPLEKQSLHLGFSSGLQRIAGGEW